VNMPGLRKRALSGSGPMAGGDPKVALGPKDAPETPGQVVRWPDRVPSGPDRRSTASRGRVRSQTRRRRRSCSLHVRSCEGATSDNGTNHLTAARLGSRESAHIDQAG